MAALRILALSKHFQLDPSTLSQEKLDERFNYLRRKASRDGTIDSEAYLETQLLYDIYSSPKAREEYMKFGKLRAAQVLDEEMLSRVEKAAAERDLTAIKAKDREQATKEEREKRLLALRPVAQSHNQGSHTIVAPAFSSNELATRAKSQTDDARRLEAEKIQAQLALDFENLKSTFKKTWSTEKTQLDRDRDLAWIQGEGTEALAQAKAAKLRLEQEIQVVEKDCRVLKGKHAQLLEALQVQDTRLESDVNQRKSENEAKERELEKEMAKDTTLSAKIQTSREEYRRLENELRAMDAEIKSLKREFSAQFDQKIKITADVVQQKKEILAEKMEKRRLEDEMIDLKKNHQAQIESQLKENEALMARHVELHGKADNISRENEMMQKEISGLDLEKTRLKDKFRELKKKNAEHQVQIQEQRSTNEKLSARHVELLGAAAMMEKEVSGLEKENTRLAERLCELKGINSNQLKLIITQTHDNKMLETRHFNLLDAGSHITTAIKHAQSQHDVLLHDLECEQNGRVTLEMELKSTSSEILILRSELKTQNEVKNGIREELNQIRKHILTKQLEKEGLELQLEELQNISANYREELRNKSEEKEREAAKQLELVNELQIQKARCQEVNSELESQKLRQASLKEELEKSSLQTETLEAELRTMDEDNAKLQQRLDEAEEKVKSGIFQHESLCQSEMQADLDDGDITDDLEIGIATCCTEARCNLHVVSEGMSESGIESKAEAASFGIEPKPSSNRPVFQCKICDKELKNKSSFSRHKRTHDTQPNPTLTCKLCGKTHSRRDNFRRHVLRHIGREQLKKQTTRHQKSKAAKKICEKSSISLTR